MPLGPNDIANFPDFTAGLRYVEGAGFNYQGTYYLVVAKGGAQAPTAPQLIASGKAIELQLGGGIKGATGDKGAQGDQGPAGIKGPDGPDGLQGAPGPQGIEGLKGATGPAGATGPKGFDGPQGAKGAQGDDGPSGPWGPTGPTGPVGAVGPQGDPGENTGYPVVQPSTRALSLNDITRGNVFTSIQGLRDYLNIKNQGEDPVRVVVRNDRDELFPDTLVWAGNSDILVGNVQWEGVSHYTQPALTAGSQYKMPGIASQTQGFAPGTLTVDKYQSFDGLYLYGNGGVPLIQSDRGTNPTVHFKNCILHAENAGSSIFKIIDGGGLGYAERATIILENCTLLAPAGGSTLFDFQPPVNPNNEYQIYVLGSTNLVDNCISTNGNAPLTVYYDWGSKVSVVQSGVNSASEFPNNGGYYNSLQPRFSGFYKSNSFNFTLITRYLGVGTGTPTTPTLPPSCSPGEEVQVFDSQGLAGTNNITVSPGAQADSIAGASTDVISTNFGSSTYKLLTVNDGTDKLVWFKLA